MKLRLQNKVNKKGFPLALNKKHNRLFFQGLNICREPAGSIPRERSPALLFIEIKFFGQPLGTLYPFLQRDPDLLTEILKSV